MKCGVHQLFVLLLLSSLSLFYIYVYIHTHTHTHTQSNIKCMFTNLKYLSHVFISFSTLFINLLKQDTAPYKIINLFILVIIRV